MPQTRVRPVRAVAAATALLLLLGAGGCVHKASRTPLDASLPAGDQLIREAALAMRNIQSAHVSISADRSIADLPVRSAEADLDNAGNAKGTVQVQQLGTLLELQFVVKDRTMHIKGATGGWTTLPASLAATIYDPSAILDPDRGVAKVLETATGTKTEAKERVDGADAYRVSVTFNKDAIAQLVPGVSGDLPGQVWIDAATKQLRRVKLSVPNAAHDASGTVTIGVSKINTPVTIVAP